MANLDVTELSVVEQNKEELLQYTSIPEKGGLRHLRHRNRHFKFE